MRRPPVRYWRALTGDIWRLTAVTGAVLTAIVAFAAGVRPLAEGLLQPADALRFMALALVPMLQFTAPFAAGLAATLAYHRLASENEDVAMAAAGVSRRSLLAPAGLTGLALAVIVAFLAHQVIPGLMRAMQQLVTRDAASLLVGSIQRGEAARFGGFAIFADRVIRGDDDPARGITDRLFLFGVVAYDEAPDGSIRAEVAARRAEVLLTLERRPDEDRPASVVRMLLHGAVGRRAGEALGEVGSVTIGPWVVPNAFEDSPRFRTFTQLGELARRPALHPAVDVRRRALARELAVREAQRRVTTAIRTEGRVTLGDGLGGRVTVWADDAHPADPGRAIELRPASGGITVDRAGPEGATSLIARAGVITLRADETDGAPRADLTLTDVRDPTDATPPRARAELPGLVPPGGSSAEAASLSSAALVSRARAALAQTPDDAAIRTALTDLESRIARLRREILGNHHERSALAVACLFIALLGGTVALRLRQGGALQVHLWAFFPALGAVVTISGGENAVAETPAAGLIVLWSGVAALAGLWVIQARRLSRPTGR